MDSLGVYVIKVFDELERALDELRRAARRLATEADMFLNDEGEAETLEQAIIDIERLTQGAKK